MHRFPFILVAGGALALAGCQNDFHKGPVYPLRAGFLPQNVYRANNVLALRRVVLLPPYDARAESPRRQDLDFVFSAELGAAGRFEVVPVSRNELISLCGRDQINSTEGLPPRLVAALRGEYAADAVMFVDITQDDPYSPITLGVRAKLVDARGGLPILWSCDTVFNGGNPAVAASAQRYQLDTGRQAFPAEEDGASVLLNPVRFARYAANAVFRTLPR